MAVLKVRIKDEKTLILDEDGKKGDLIDLTVLESVDSTYLTSFISGEAFRESKSLIEKEYKAKENELVSKYTNELDKLNEKINTNESQKKLEFSALKNEIETTKNKEFFEKETKYKDEINLLKSNFQEEKNEIINKLNTFEASKALDIEKLKNELKNKYEQEKANEINKLTEKLVNIQNELNNIKTKHELENQTAKLNYQEELNKIKTNFEKEKFKLNETISKITLSKANLNVKMLGEELEKWCNEEFEAYASSGFDNTSWEKDNQAIQADNEAKGTKADYIFRVYLDQTKSLELSSVCLEMKNESLTSKNKKKNSDHYQKLDQDRKKKNCEYALLISELEWDSLNDAPIKKVREYEKMYVVRPQYFITFLSLITSLSNKYRSIISEKEIERINLKSSLEILDEFNSLKETYLEKPMETLTKKIADIQKQTENIAKANQAIQQNCSDIFTTTIDTMKTKINNFKIQKIVKELKKIE